MGIIFLPDAHSLEIVELEAGHMSPAGAVWVNIGPFLGGCWYMDGNLPVPCGHMAVTGEYRSRLDAVDQAIAYAHKVKVARLWIEFDARRCD